MITLENSPGLAELLMNEKSSGAGAEQFVRWAQDALEAGYDSPALIRLAVQDPPFFTPDLRNLFGAVGQELGIEEVTFEQARVFYAQQLAKELIAVSAAPRLIAQRLAQVFPPHSTYPPFEVWWLLEEAYACDYVRDGVELRGKGLEDAIVEETTSLLAFDWRAA